MTLSDLETAAVNWWRTKRPIVWSQAKHLQNATVNTTTDAETDLAIAVRKLLVSRQRGDGTP